MAVGTRTKTDRRVEPAHTLPPAPASRASAAAAAIRRRAASASVVGRRSSIYNHKRSRPEGPSSVRRNAAGRPTLVIKRIFDAQSLPQSRRCSRPVAPAAAPAVDFKDLTRQIQRAPGFPEALAALKNGRGGHD